MCAHATTRRAAVAAFAMLALVTTGCGAGQLTQTAGQGATSGGVAARVGTLELRDAVLVFSGPVPGDTVYEAGQDAPVQVTIVNEGPAADRLVAVGSPVARSGRVVGDAVIPGGQTLTAGYDDPAAAVTLPGAAAVQITLVGLTEPVRAGLSYPVDLTFERAGTVRLVVPVEYADVPAPRAQDAPR